MKAICSICGLVLRSRRSTKGTAKANLLKAIRKHQWKFHRNTMISRIKRGKRLSQENPSAQDFVSALQEGPRSALKIYDSLTKSQYVRMKIMMDALEPLLPTEVRIVWKMVEAVHDRHRPSS